MWPASGRPGSRTNSAMPHNRRGLSPLFLLWLCPRLPPQSGHCGLVLWNRVYLSSLHTSPARRAGQAKNAFTFSGLNAALVNSPRFRFALVVWVDELATATAPWTETEFAQRDLGDARRNKRARILMERFAAGPTANVPKACQGWGETMAAYRFFDNDSVDWAGDRGAALAADTIELASQTTTGRTSVPLFCGGTEVPPS
ncbi:hypothetical protein F1735_23750 [Massilia sp. CCM 8694]|uniref:Transposase Tn5-like N-terminal domain-containing protein n=1 Tax=Massilia genomosp. 1 TaxID=2609280 RepID=A0ABX0MTA4_9BURK|nr:hypothetical protein [Massilia genomosp. 1]